MDPANIQPDTDDIPILYLVVARLDGGPWTWQLCGEKVQSISFQNQKRADAGIEVLRFLAKKDGMEDRIEYRWLRILGGVRQV